MNSIRDMKKTGMPVQWTIVVDYVPGQGWEAYVSDAPAKSSLREDDGWDSTDPHTLLAAVGRDLSEAAG